MEIEITQFISKEEPKNYSNSIHNSGLQNIGEITWDNAKKANHSFVTKDNRQIFIDYFNEFGAWDDLDQWPLIELNALFVQMISGDIQEMESYDSFEEYEKSDQTSSSIFKTTDNKYFFYVGH